MRVHVIMLVAAASFLAACDRAPGNGAEAEGAEAAQVASADADASPRIVVYKSPTCGCCTGWVEHLRAAGHEVEAVDLVVYRDLQTLRAEQGVPDDLGACHTALVDRYTVEGHVPAEVIERMLRERPDIKGIAVPGMPIGSPGMEGPNARPYDVIAFTEDGERTVFERVDPRQ